MDLYKNGTYHRTFWYRQFLENPDLEAVARSMARPIQVWCYALLDSALGLPERPPQADTQSVAEEQGLENEGNGDEDEDEDEDELIDVVEDDSEEEKEEDPLAPLRGALQQLDGPQVDAPVDATPEPASSVSSHARSTHSLRPRMVVEYVRRGTRLAAEDIEVPSIAKLQATIGHATNVDEDEDEDVAPIPPQLLSAEERLALLRKILDSDIVLIRTLPAEQRIAALALRWMVSRLYVRARDSGGSREREKERWTKHEARAFLASFSWGSPRTLDVEEDAVPVMDRNVQLVAQVLATMDAIQRLSQILLVDDSLPSSTLPFSGHLFHAYLSGTKQFPPDVVRDRLWHAAVDELDHVFIEPSGKRRKKDRRKEAEGSSIATSQRTTKGQKANGLAAGGMFGLLASLEA